MFASLARSWRFATTSYTILWRNKSLLLLPILATLSATAVLISFAAPLLATGTLQGWLAAVSAKRVPPEQKVVMGLVSFVFYFCNYFIIVYFNSALVAGALRAIAGEPLNLREALAAASGRLPQILGWAALSAVIGVILRSIENSHEKLGQIVAAVLGTGWTVMTYFVIPVIVVDGVGPVTAIKNSLSVLRSHWGTALTGNLSLGLIGFLIMLPLYLLAVGLVVLGIAAGHVAALVPCIGGAVVVCVLASAVSGAADMIFKALLFNFATGRSLPPDIDTEDLHHAFRVR